MKKALILIILIVIVFITGIYVISIAFTDVEVNEESPLDRAIVDSGGSGIKQINDNLDVMDDETKADFEEQTELMKDDIKIMDDDMPGAVKLLLEGMFKARAHGVEGKALLIEDGDDKIIRFEDFDTINGPALRIYLSSDLGDDDFVDLGPIKATKGNVNYDIPAGTDTSKYKNVLVWCKPFGVLFSYAELE